MDIHQAGTSPKDVPWSRTNDALAPFRSPARHPQASGKVWVQLLTQKILVEWRSFMTTERMWPPKSGGGENVASIDVAALREKTHLH